MERSLVIIPDPILRKKAKPISDFSDPQLRPLLSDMIRIMKRREGVGLAAPQVGVSQRIILIDQKEDPIILINPEIVKKSFRKEIDEEGCISIPNIFGIVKRYRSIAVTAFNLHGDPISFSADHLLARIIQHEIDHCDGILFIDRAIKITKGEIPL